MQGRVAGVSELGVELRQRLILIPLRWNDLGKDLRREAPEASPTPSEAGGASAWPCE